ncbi:MAG: hypothetical protein JJU29_11825 [Verrucomicrobia bacterium]|nr:hypothetical protein [Verrucomicrobiota bacterium]MCH8513531.1 hypothetical protein [Kiritimatiellia bacterium]
MKYLFFCMIFLISCQKQYIPPKVDQDLVSSIRKGSVFSAQINSHEQYLPSLELLEKFAVELNEIDLLRQVAFEKRVFQFYFSDTGEFLYVFQRPSRVTTWEKRNGYEIETNYRFVFFQGTYQVYENVISFNIQSRHHADFISVPHRTDPGAGFARLLYYENQAKRNAKGEVFEIDKDKNHTHHFYDFYEVDLSNNEELELYINHGKIIMYLNNQRQIVFTKHNIIEEGYTYNFHDRVVFPIHNR